MTEPSQTSKPKISPSLTSMPARVPQASPLDLDSDVEVVLPPTGKKDQITIKSDSDDDLPPLHLFTSSGSQSKNKLSPHQQADVKDKPLRFTPPAAVCSQQSLSAKPSGPRKRTTARSALTQVQTPGHRKLTSKSTGHVPRGKSREQSAQPPPQEMHPALTDSETCAAIMKMFEDCQSMDCKGQWVDRDGTVGKCTGGFPGLAMARNGPFAGRLFIGCSNYQQGSARSHFVKNFPNGFPIYAFSQAHLEWDSDEWSIIPTITAAAEAAIAAAHPTNSDAQH